MNRGSVRALRDDPAPARDVGRGVLSTPRNEEAVEYEGWNLHASVAIAADDDFGREKLMRYGARPPIAMERLRRLPGGLVGYRIKRLRNGRQKLRVMTPLELLARPAAIVPPPRYPLLRYHGVLAPKSSWRRDVVQRPPARRPCVTAPRSPPPHPQRTEPASRREPKSEPSGARASRHSRWNTPTGPRGSPPGTPAHAATPVAPTAPVEDGTLLDAALVAPTSSP